MISGEYRSQVDLLTRVLPAVVRERDFALKGGTGINLFVRDMPRLSVDIDLTYLPITPRAEALTEIANALGRIQSRVENLLPGLSARIVAQGVGQESKLTCRWNGALVTIEVNTTIRGALWPVQELPIARSAQELFGMSASANIVSNAELFGGKICAALDRQHPRDLFDVQQLLTNEGFNDEIRLGFLAMLLSHGRPIHELLRPQLQDQREHFDKQFAGMTVDPYTYDEFQATRVRLIQEIHASLQDDDREFLLTFKSGQPNWRLFPRDTLRNMPAVQWKLSNIQWLKQTNPTKHAVQLDALRKSLAK